ncbi:mycofactocin dehydrogenase MftG [Nocardia sp. NBC_01329]|uniref:mycofactocin dehydrogenase MftG n=1 Tax=Nocardia sp. NBC_01329 TaxID=2903594 RepID=UPI002E103D3D|nr:mycofactocin system GMC family oxidoreductase MftG [Nocardia sp. NBC_01329]
MVHTLIIGSGTAGCVLAARLSEDPGHTVRVVEAGSHWAHSDDFPPELADSAELPLGDRASWLWRYSVALTPDRPGTIVRGRGIGGSGSVNGSYFIRAAARDFAAWSGETGSRSWDFGAALPYFRALENDHDYGDHPGHGRAGPVPVRRIVRPTPLIQEFGAACRDLGFGEVADWNALPGGPESGVGPVPCTVGPPDASGRRHRIGPAHSYLLPALSRPNLTVQGDTLVIRLRFQGTRVTGADCLIDGKPETIRAERVVLCAGAIESAALLLRSGIGPGEQSAALGIPVVAEVPVGGWFTDHPEIGIDYRHPAPAGRSVPLEYVLEFDDIEIRPYTVAFIPGAYRMGVTLMRPTSAGSIRLTTADPLTAPRIEHGYLETADDRTRLRDAVELAGQILESMAAEPLGAAGPVSDRWLRDRLGTSQHLAGTCRMGRAGDPRAVVDDRFRVHGVAGLSVVDLSVVPVPLSRGPQATVVLLAERATAELR